MRSNAWSTIEHSHVDPHSLRCPTRPYAPSLQHLRRGSSEAVTCDRLHNVRSNAVRSNATPTIERTWSWHSPEIECRVDDRTQVGLQSIAPPAIERILDLAAHLILSINRTLLFSFHFYVFEAPWRLVTSLLITVIPLNRYLFYNIFILLLISLLVPSLWICLYIFMFSSYFLSFRFMFIYFNTF